MIDWKGYEVAIIASGPSLTAEDCARVGEWREANKAARRCIVINSTYRLAMFADVLYACDFYWWEKYWEQICASGFAGQLWTQDQRAKNRYEVNLIVSQRNKGLSRRKDTIHQGGNSGFQAINFAYLAGAFRIILLGFDMQMTGGKKHHFGNHPEGLNKNLPFKMWIPEMEVLAADLKREAIEVVNATRETALTCFARLPIEDALA